MYLSILLPPDPRSALPDLEYLSYACFGGRDLPPDVLETLPMLAGVHFVDGHGTWISQRFIMSEGCYMLLLEPFGPHPPGLYAGFEILGSSKAGHASVLLLYTGADP